MLWISLPTTKPLPIYSLASDHNIPVAFGGARIYDHIPELSSREQIANRPGYTREY